MHVNANLTRRDLFLVGLSLLPTSRANWVLMVLFSLASFGLSIQRNGSSDEVLVVSAVVAPVVGTGAVLAAFLANAACLLVAAKGNSGVFGMHEFSLTPAGLQERTAVNDSHYTWQGIKAVIKLRRYLLIHVHGAASYVIPRMAFSSPAQYEAFCAQALSHWQLARQPG